MGLDTSLLDRGDGKGRQDGSGWLISWGSRGLEKRNYWVLVFRTTNTQVDPKSRDWSGAVQPQLETQERRDETNEIQ